MSSNPLEEYTKLGKLGEGTYGVVYKAKHEPSGQIVALKKIKLDPHSEEGIPATTLREVSLLKQLKHPCIVKLERSLYVRGELYLVCEFLDNDLKKFLDGIPGQLPSLTLKQFSYKLTEAVRHCHANRVLHRDLKPQNILIGSNGELKLADFGLSREHGLPISRLTHEVVTLWYRPPEILLGSDTYSGAVDVWGIACVIAEMARKRPLFPGDCEFDQLCQIFRVKGTPTEDNWPGVTSLPDYSDRFPGWNHGGLDKALSGMDPVGIDLLKEMLVYAPNKRITAKRALQHPWFDDVRDEMEQSILAARNLMALRGNRSDDTVAL